MSRWSWVLTRIVRQIWFRAMLISLLSVALAVVAGVISPWLPYEFGGEMGRIRSAPSSRSWLPAC